MITIFKCVLVNSASLMSSQMVFFSILGRTKSPGNGKQKPSKADRRFDISVR